MKVAPPAPWVPLNAVLLPVYFEWNEQAAYRYARAQGPPSAAARRNVVPLREAIQIDDEDDNEEAPMELPRRPGPSNR